MTSNNYHVVDLNDAAELCENYRNSPVTGEPAYQTINKHDLQLILDQEGCVGIHIYPAKDSTGNKSSVFVGVDDSGDDMTAGVILDRSVCPCPNFCTCAHASALNNI